MFLRNDCYEKVFLKFLSFCVVLFFKNCMDIMLFMLIYMVIKVFLMVLYENILN